MSEPAEQSNKNKTLKGLALSGGGFRAVLFHTGALIRLNELGLLSQLDRITSVSGGSIVSGRLAVSWNNLDFSDTGVSRAFQSQVVTPLRALCSQNLDLRVIILGLLPIGKGVTDRLMDAYDRALYDERTLDELPPKPHFIYQAANLSTGRSVRFSNRRIADYLIGEIKDVSSFRLSQAVAASSAFPPVLSPLVMRLDPDVWSPMDGADLFDDVEQKSELLLTDGGSYDNLGVERIDGYGTILVSDAGAAFRLQRGFALLSPKQVLRTLNMTMDQVRSVRLRYLFDMVKQRGDTVSYWGIGQKPDKLPLSPSLNVSPDTALKLSRTRTRLNRFTDEEQEQLINWGYAVCDVATQRFQSDASPAPKFPHPERSM